ncbi:lipopolysaccharide assembly protein LapA domain-containing protein [Pseudomonas chlororaphis]|uniref:lipopolysaccharide assembly protein LapA domain-containing protein n=1 Tax=Pseudomonas chlororaphis TaxID=587753 RepID=UPI00131A5D82|nr:lipopolysaccharide assembly protein LapA domain-containing protein [Pseudomonas chlororaphis]
MRTLKRVLLAIVFLAFALSILVFVLENQEAIVLSFLGGSISAFPVSIYIIFSLLIGMVFGPLLSFVIKGGAKKIVTVVSYGYGVKDLTFLATRMRRFLVSDTGLLATF